MLHRKVSSAARDAGVDLTVCAASRGWANGFLKRRHISLRAKTRQVRFTPDDAAAQLDAFNEKMKQIMAERGTPVFFEYLPKSTIGEKRVNTAWVRSAGKAKERFTCMLLEDSLRPKYPPKYRVPLSVRFRLKTQKFSIFFDGWNHAFEHYAAVFACVFPLLCMTPFVNNETDDLSAATHQAFLALMIARDYQKRLDHCIFIVGDNCSAQQIRHRAAQRVSRGSLLVSIAIGQAPNFTPLPSSDLCTILSNFSSFQTNLRPIKHQQTRWSSIFAMLNSFFNLFHSSTWRMKGSPTSKRCLRDLLAEPKDIEFVSKALQRSDVILLNVRAWFDRLIALKQSYIRYLDTLFYFCCYKAPRADIVHSPDVEASCIRLLKGQAELLTRAEKAAIEHFSATPRAREDDHEENDKEESLSFVERFQKPLRLED
ncbi:hypothetical protein PHPALM_28775 [Phytophthora palmivora]|uniref:HTH CENPB-type domain-containing protein n=1 Tax=Phytophthora palmivora TaxID=4796 RepID=A0A2P4X997_9STRA|nr:hypothetical protein PHPALM_28775 [Phytophthora palmivora]